MCAAVQERHSAGGGDEPGGVRGAGHQAAGHEPDLQDQQAPHHRRLLLKHSHNLSLIHCPKKQQSQYL